MDTNNLPLLDVAADPLQDEERPVVELIYDSKTDTTAMKNILLIHDGITDYNTFVNAANSDTFPIVYSNFSSKDSLIKLLQEKFVSISRVAFVFHNGEMNPSKIFLDDEPLFTNEDLTGVDNFSNNMKFVIEMTNSYHVEKLDFLACDTLQYDTWKTYYKLLKDHTGAVIGASDDLTGNLKYGGDWKLESTNEDIKNVYFTNVIENYQYTLDSTIISQSGGTVYLRQQGPTLAVEWRPAGTNVWTEVVWPLTITNTASSPTTLILELTTDITFSGSVGGSSGYIFIGSVGIVIDGLGKKFNISNVANYLGLVKNGTSSINGYTNVLVQNIGVEAVGTTTLAGSQGWLCQQYFGKGISSDGILIKNCYSTGRIASRAGGIFGVNAGQGASGNAQLSAVNCFSIGSIGTSGGGIFGSYAGYQASGSVRISAAECYSTGEIGGADAGGIFGIDAGQLTSGTVRVYAQNCYSTGIIRGDDAGGICGSYAGQDASVDAQIYAENCYSTGTIFGLETGGIFGGYAGNGAVSRASIYVSNCYTIGAIDGTNAGGIYGANQNSEVCLLPANCITSLEYGTTWSDENATATIETQATGIWLNYSTSSIVPWLLKRFGAQIYDPSNKIVYVGTGGTSVQGSFSPNFNYIIYGDPQTAGITIDDPSTGVLTCSGEVPEGEYVSNVLVGKISNQGIYSAYNSNTYTFNVEPVPTAPDLPTNVQAVATGYATADVTFDVPDDGGSPIISYTVTGYTVGPIQDQSQVFAASIPQPFTMTGLTQGTEYTFTVVATNEIGSSQPGGPSNSITTFTNISQSGGLVQLRQQNPTSQVEWSPNGTDVWTAVVWPLTITNTDLSDIILAVELITDITFGSVDEGYVGGLDGYIIMNSNKIVIDGLGKTVALYDVANYPGLTKNGSSSFVDGVITTVNGFTDITIQNIGVETGGIFGSLGGTQGWLCQRYFGTGISTGEIKVTKCYSTGAIPDGCGGIFGDSIGYQASGGKIFAENCYSTGAIGGGGGIFGNYAGYGSTGSTEIYATKCYSTGTIGNSAGGIFGFRMGYNINVPSSATVKVYALNCYSTGTIGPDAGGIVGSKAGNFANGGGRKIIYVINCYTIGSLSTRAGEMYGSDKNANVCSDPENCDARDDNIWSDTQASGTIATAEPNAWLNYSTSPSVPWLLNIFNAEIYNPNTAGFAGGAGGSSNPGAFQPGYKYIMYSTPVTGITINQDDGTITCSSQVVTNVYIIQVLVGKISNNDIYSAYNRNVFSFTVTSPSVPGAPTNVQAVATGSNTANITFNVDRDGGRAIISYTVTSDEGNVQVFAASIPQPFTMTGLTEDTEYTFTVVATNEVGSSFASDPSNPIRTFINNISQSGGTVQLRQLTPTSQVEWSPNGTNVWGGVGWSLTITNTASLNTTLTVQLTTDITISASIGGANGYIIIGSDGITIDTDDGVSKVVTVDGITNYPGLVMNGTGNGGAYTNITIQNIGITTLNNSTLLESGGWICQQYFGYGAVSGIMKVLNCYSTGAISGYGGGICGRNLCFKLVEIIGSTLQFYAENCYSTGAIGTESGGIFGRAAGENASNTMQIYAKNCYSTGAIGTESGGIFGYYAGASASGSGRVYAENCYSTGEIGTESGGIFGPGGGRAASGSAEIYATNCYSTGEISGEYAGGIFGTYAGRAASGSGQIYATNCYSTGEISGEYAGGIFGSFAGNPASGSAEIYAEYCYSTGTIGNSAGGIFGSGAGNAASGGQIYAQNCYSTGEISNLAGGIFGSNAGFGAQVGVIISVKRCYTIGVLSTGAGGIYGADKNSVVCSEPDNCTASKNNIWADSEATDTIETGATDVWLNYSTLTNVPWLLNIFGAQIYNPDNQTIPGGTDGRSNPGVFQADYTYIIYSTALTGITINLGNGRLTCTSKVVAGIYISDVLVGKISNEGVYSAYNRNTFTFTVTPPSVPGAPTNVQAVATGSETADITFNVPYDGDSAIISYTVTSYTVGPIQDQSQVFAASIPQPFTMTGLTQGTEYTFTVVATNEIGSSQPGGPSNSITTFTNISQQGGDVQLRQRLEISSAVEWSPNGTNVWSTVGWPLIVTNTDETATLTVQLTTDITLSADVGGVNGYIIIGSDRITIDTDYGVSKVVTVDGVTDYLGLVRNGYLDDNTGVLVNGFTNITIQNVGVETSGTTTLKYYEGWVCQQYFGNGISSGAIKVENCYSTGAIGIQTGGIFGINTGMSASGDAKIYSENCYSTGAIGDFAGGIFAYAAGRSASGDAKIYSENCYSTGAIGDFAGGIFGYYAGAFASGDAKIYAENCFSTGEIGTESGGIFAQYAGGNIESTSVGIYALNCYSTGTIGPSNAGGIFGSNAGLPDTLYVGPQFNANIYATNCYSTGEIYGGGGGIFGAYTTNPQISGRPVDPLTYSISLFAKNCYTLGSINGTNTGGIFGSNSILEPPPATLDFSATNCYTIGSINGTGAGGICSSTNKDTSVLNCRSSPQYSTIWIDANATETIAKEVVDVWLDYSTSIDVPWILKTFDAQIYSPSGKTIVGSDGGSSDRGLFSPGYKYIIYNNPVIAGITISSATGVITCSNTLVSGTYIINVLVGKVSNDIYSAYNLNTYTFDVTNPSVPGAPTNVSAVANGSVAASVSFTAPLNNGGSVITSYVATSSPGGIQGTKLGPESGIILVTGLTQDTTYTFTVVANNADGFTSAPSNASFPITTFTQSVSQSGGTVYLRQRPEISQVVEWSPDGLTSWKQVVWPLTIINTTPLTTTLTVQLTTNITFGPRSSGYVGDTNGYIIIGSNKITINGTNKIVNIFSVSSYPGLVKNESDAGNGFTNITVQNIVVEKSGIATLGIGQGWVCQGNFGKGISTGIIKVDNCRSNGTIREYSGGIFGAGAGLHASGDAIIYATNCFTTGEISGQYGAGIFGVDTGSDASGNAQIYATDCYTTGPITGNFAGGIFGPNAGRAANGDAQIYAINCFTTGEISGQYGGGIFGQAAGYESRLGAAQIHATDCYATGSITGEGSGGIFGGLVGQASSGGANIFAKNCYTTGEIGDNAGGIFGNRVGFQSTSNALQIYASNCYTLGAISGVNAGGIYGSNAGEFPTNAQISVTKCYTIGEITGTDAGGIYGANNNNAVCSPPVTCRTSLEYGTTWSDVNADATIAQEVVDVWLNYSTSIDVPWILKTFEAQIYNPDIQSIMGGSGGSSNPGLFQPDYEYIIYNTAVTGITINDSNGVITCTSKVVAGIYVSNVLVGKISNDGIYTAYNSNTYTFNVIQPSVPSVPTDVEAFATGSTTANVSFTASTYNGGSAIQSYIATSSPGGIQGIKSGSGSGIIPVSGLSSGQIYTFTVVAVNSVGTSAPSTPSNFIRTFTVPGAPTNVSAAAKGSTTASVSFTAPEDNGGTPILNYIATSSPGGIQGIISGSGSGTIPVSGLSSGTTYTFTVVANNYAGTSAQSTPSDPIRTFTVPGAPIIGVATATGSTTASVSFTAPVDNGGTPIISYTATSSPGGIQGILSGSNSGTISVSGLSSGTTYTFTVVANNSVGTSAPSAESNPITPSGNITVPGAPTNVSAVATGSTKATVFFTAPAYNGGSAIISYTATSSPGGIQGTSLQSGSGTIDMIGLSSGQTYTFTVVANNAVGKSASSTPSNLIRTFTVPGTPIIGVATATGSTTATVTFTAPSYNGGTPIISYTATSSPDGIQGTLLQSGSGTISVAGLSSGVAYTFTVVANNAVGTSASSAASNSIETFTVPGAPTNVSATVTGSTTATVSFTAPIDDGGSTIISYTATSRPDGIKGTVSQSGSGTIQMSGLAGGRAYTFTVVATNAVGTSISSAASNSITTLDAIAITSGTAIAGTKIIPVDIAQLIGFRTGDTIKIENGDVQETQTIASFGSIITTEPLLNTYPSGSIVLQITGSQTTPGAPFNLVASAGNRKASISFLVNDGGSPITNMSYSLNGRSFINFNPPQTSSPVTIFNLINNIKYEISLKATNVFGTGPASLPVSVIPVLCFNEGTLILCLSESSEEVYIPIENLKKGDMVKSYKHGYRKIDLIHSGSLVNDPSNSFKCMYKMEKNHTNGLIKDLIVTGGHSILVDDLGEQQKENNLMWSRKHFAKVVCNNKKMNTLQERISQIKERLGKCSKQPIMAEKLTTRIDYLENKLLTLKTATEDVDEEEDFTPQIDDKYLLFSSISKDFAKMETNETFNWYHFILENDGDDNTRFGVWANGILSETPSKNQLIQMGWEIDV